jgi:rhamnose utilization protein RhaD (predicted bifunctional aldolase and dehydrogenase)/NAD(P)-dependent dehydrogenase (short-subunit alcohol dehydrogenase family)
MRNTWSELEAAEYLKRCDPRWGTDLALAAYSTLLLQNERSLAWQGRGNVSVKGTYSNVFSETVPAIFVMEYGQRHLTAEYPEHIAIDLTYLRRLRSLSELPDDQMLNELRTHVFDFRAPVPPVETLVHSFLPMKYIAHVHAGALSAVADRADGREFTRRVLGDRVIVLPYCKPGFELAKTTVEAYEDFPEARAVIWMHHGVLTWGETASAAYDAAVDLITEAEKWLDGQAGKPIQAAMHSPPESVRERVLRVAPVLRGLLGQALRGPDERLSRMIIQPVTDAAILDLLASSRGKELALGPPLTCHYLKHTKPVPMWLDAPAYDDPDRLRGQLSDALSEYAREYEAYVSRNAVAATQTRLSDSMPRIVLIPGLGALCAGPDLETSMLVRDVASSTLSVKARITDVAGCEALPEVELFRMEYGSFEQSGTKAKMPLVGRVAIVTGAAGAIGSGISEALLQQGCAVALADLPGERLDLLLEDFHGQYGDLVMPLPFDVTEPAQVADAFDRVILAWGGVDLVVVNAGIALVSSLAQMNLEKFRRLESVNIEGTLNVLSESARHFQLQRAGGDVVLISTKNVFAPGAEFGAYSATKAAAHQLARIASLELAELDVRVNMVAPDNVFAHGARRSGLWAEVGSDRARSKGLVLKDLEDHYRSRNLLKSKISSSDVANAVLYFATHQSPTTGATIPVDGGLPAATPR